MTLRPRWRHFMPQRQVALQGVPPPLGDVYAQARARVMQLMEQSSDLERVIAQQKQQTIQSSDPVAWLTLLTLQAPRAATAQIEMDKHPHGYSNKKERLYELIDFNDTFVNTVLALPESMLKDFEGRLKHELDIFCDARHAPSFSGEQYQAIVHGLSREIAVYLGAKKEGLEPLMTSRTADAFGIDMQIRDPATNKYVNIDCKTRSAFHFRLTDLVHQGRIAPHDQIDAETKGFWGVVNRHNDERVNIILMRIAVEELGDITDFSFASTTILGETLRHIIAQRGLNDDQFGMLE